MTQTGASILEGFGRAISHIFKSGGVNRLAILTIFALGLSDSCVKRKVCFTLSDLGVDLPPIVGGGQTPLRASF